MFFLAGRPGSRRSVLAGLALALAGLVVAAVLLSRSSDGPVTRPADFGAASGGSASAPSRTAQPPAAPAAGNSERGTPSPSLSNEPEPTGLILPRLGVRAPVDAVGVAPDGQTEVPKDPQRVGWYRFSPAPGSAEGSSVIVGHVDSTGYGLGVLVALNEVRQGDLAIVQRTDGSRVEYRVTARRTVGKKELAGSEAFRRDGPPVLTLITCSGPYVPEKGGYQNNLVVTAGQVPE
ncbi:class F sortase [Streptomyces asoensis]|uniref:class F sortase n=1 Tax=Streptomyces asoensis TaxID=249586 RepID=UPI0033EBD2BE